MMHNVRVTRPCRTGDEARRGEDRLGLDSVLVGLSQLDGFHHVCADEERESAYKSLLLFETMRFSSQKTYST
jgi:hypothetical protein